MSFYSVLRMVFMFLICAGGLLTRFISFPGILIGLVGLKTAVGDALSMAAVLFVIILVLTLISRYLGDRYNYENDNGR